MPSPDTSAVTEPEPTVAEEVATLLFGRYRRIRELGRGGMGVVLLAHDTELDMPVALKLVPQQVVQDTQGIIDLKKEVLRGMSLTHPGIVRVFTFEHDATTAAIVMEYVEGQTLSELKARETEGCFDCAQVRPWLEQICTVLEYAHRDAHIAHRDLKPGNLMLTPPGRLKVADFGIASSLSDTMSRVSVRADSCGTPPYMSPQQAGGERPSQLDDIYSLGATLYDLLTGKPPFFRGNVLAQVLGAVPPPMVQRRAELGISERAPIPAAWEKMVAACLAKDPAQRPPDAAAILRLLDGSPVKAPSPTSNALAAPLHYSNSERGVPRQERPSPAVAPPIIRVSCQRPIARRWPRQVVRVVLAAAIAAGGLYAARRWRPFAAAPTANVPTSTAESRTSPPASRLHPSKGLEIGRLDDPPKKELHRPGPPPVGRP